METHKNVEQNTPQHKPFLSQITPPDGLYPKIIARIHVLEMRALFVRRVTLWGVSFISIVGLIPSLSYLVSAFALSSFGQYLSLVASDGDIVLLNWKEFAFSLIESLPLMNITLVSIMLLGLIYSITSLVDQEQTRPTLQLA